MLTGSCFGNNSPVKSTVKFKYLSNADIEYFCSTNEGIGKAGGYTLTGYAESFVSYLSGSFSNIIGLPLCETANMLKSVGVKTQNLL
jgi:septum formation protein